MKNLKINLIKNTVLVCLLLLANVMNAQTFLLKAPKGYSDYKWYSTNLVTGVSTIVAGADKDTLSVSDAGLFYCDFETKTCRRKSDVVILVNRCQLKQDTAVTINAGTMAAGNYQWFKNNTAMVGSTNATKLVTYNDENDYYAEIYNGSCTLKTENFIVRAIKGGLANISAIMLNCKQ